MGKKIAMALVAALAVFGIVAAMQPAEFKVSRSAVINAAPEAVFAQVNTLQAWDAWSPWAKLDPNAQHAFEGPASGEGALMRWSGNWEVGEGSMTITKSIPAEQVDFRLDFLKPMKATNTAQFTFAPEGKQTRVTWTMEGQKDFLAKAMGLIFNCEKMVGEQFDQGLANLKAVAEGA